VYFPKKTSKKSNYLCDFNALNYSRSPNPICINVIKKNVLELKMVHDCGPFGQPGVHAETNHKV